MAKVKNEFIQNVVKAMVREHGESVNTVQIESVAGAQFDTFYRAKGNGLGGERIEPGAIKGASGEVMRQAASAGSKILTEIDKIKPPAISRTQVNSIVAQEKRRFSFASQKTEVSRTSARLSTVSQPSSPVSTRKDSSASQPPVIDNDKLRDLQAQKYMLDEIKNSPHKLVEYHNEIMNVSAAVEAEAEEMLDAIFQDITRPLPEIPKTPKIEKKDTHASPAIRERTRGSYVDPSKPLDAASLLKREGPTPPPSPQPTQQNASSNTASPKLERPTPPPRPKSTQQNASSGATTPNRGSGASEDLRVQAIKTSASLSRASGSEPQASPEASQRSSARVTSASGISPQASSQAEQSGSQKIKFVSPRHPSPPPGLKAKVEADNKKKAEVEMKQTQTQTQAKK